jgi:hypothetical protein
MRCGDFAARAEAVVRFLPPVQRRRGILATGVRRESRAIMVSGRGVSAAALGGCGAEACGGSEAQAAWRPEESALAEEGPAAGGPP